MPVTFKVATHPAKIVGGNYDNGFTAREILAEACSSQYRKAGAIRGTSFEDPDEVDHYQPTPERIYNIIPKPNGFFFALSEAYNKHHILVLRPDDVWLAILVQFNFFVNANSELLRASFVGHEGTRNLMVNQATLSDFGEFARAMVHEIDKNVSDPTLRAWVLPDFTTTTERDTTVASVTLMATLKTYFSYSFGAVACGLPSVRLEGEKADWEKLLQRADKLKEYGLQTIAWYHLLVPVLTRFIKSFDEPKSKNTIDFWQTVAHYQAGGSGPRTYTGWASAFCVFNENGRWIGFPLKKLEDVSSTMSPESLTAKAFWAKYLKRTNHRDGLLLDDTPYHVMDAGQIPPCYAEVNVLLVDSAGEEGSTTMTAGIIATEVCSSGELMKSEGYKGENDTVKPLAGWWLFDEKVR
ncbi:hypothetical protein MIND_00109600 [Mycena indigotica]|uniref:DUF4419 domain-containing protein n=1 Tax=Mycena indigotica TaxID=2126181 RepID=A0A8H6TCB2_9AGAR|nr:uncharacterized protein MIND_00109600 [Mycena indigotica]KAF7315928.1 hypothetical protein MIND_00109600 [Mycena indigotica]